MTLSKNNVLKSLKFGDVVEVNFSKRDFHGEFIRFDDERKLVVIKLKSGYDIAIAEKDISKISIIQKALSVNKKTVAVKGALPIPNPDLSIITTGGTISSKIDYKTGGVSPSVPPEYYLQIAPGLKNYGNIEINSLMSIFSEDMKPDDWVKIAKAAYDAIKKGSKGVIVTTGTDTMHFASAAISFMLNPLSVPIVFTGAQRSTDRGSSDASTNLLLSAITASKWAGAESVVCMHATLNDDYNFIIRGNRVRKMHSERRDAFRPVNSTPLAKVYLDGKIENISDHFDRGKETVLNTRIDSKAKLLVGYPGMTGDAIKDSIKRGAHGLVIAGTGFGNLPLKEKSVYEALGYAHKEGVPIVITSQTIYGATNRFVYSTLRELSGFDNIIYVENMLTETAFVKLMFAMGQTEKMGEIRNIMCTPLAGEINDKDNFGEFLI